MNTRFSILVADGSRARFFSLEGHKPRVGEAGPALVEHEDSVDPEHDLAGRDKYSATRTGGNRNPSQGQTHGYDDHRAREAREHEHRFAQAVARRALALAQEQHANQLVVVAEKRMLGLLRDALVVPPQAGFELRELARDLTRLPPGELHTQLAQAGLLPEHQARVV